MESPWEGAGVRRSDEAWAWGEAEGAQGAAGSTVLGRLAAGLDAGGAARALPVALGASLVALLVGAALSGGLYEPSVAQLAAVGPAAALAGPAILAALLVYAFRQARDDAARDAERYAALMARGANPVQALVLAAGPRALAGLLVSAVLPLVLSPVLGLLPIRAVGHTVGAAVGAAWVASVCTGLALAVVAVWGAWGPVLGASRAHFRYLGVERPALPLRWYLDLIGIAAAVALGRVAVVAAANAANAAYQAAVNGPAFGGLQQLPPANVAPPPFVFAPLVYLAPAGFALSAGYLAARLAGILAGWLDRRRGHANGPAATLLLRAVARGGAGKHLVLPAALAAAAVFAWTGGPTAMQSAAAALQMRAGSDLRVEETWAAPCAGFCTAQILQATPVPDIASANQGLPGVLSAASLVPAQDQVATGATGTTPATLVGLDPVAYGRTVRWPIGFGATGRHALALLRAHPKGVVISTSLAQATGLRVGDTMQSQILGVVPVVGEVPAWPGLPSSLTDWALVNWSALQPALNQKGAFTASGFSAYEIFRLRRGASPDPVVAALRQESLTVQDVVQGASGFGPGPLAPVLWPLGAIAALFVLGSLRLPWHEARDLPGPEATLALGAERVVADTRRVAGPTLGGLGAAWGSAVGWVASFVFWPDLQLATGPVASPLHVPRLGLWLALLALAVAAYFAVPAWRRARGEADPEVRARVAAALGPEPEPEPAPRAPRRAPAPTSRPAAPAVVPGRPAGGFGAGLRAAMAVLALAARRLAAAWVRVLGLAFGLLLAAAVAATVPVYTAGALTRVLHAGLQPYNDRPAGAVLVRWLPPQNAFASGPTTLTPAQMAELARVTQGVGRAVGLPETPLVSYEATQTQQVITAQEVNNPYAQGIYFGGTSIDSLTDLPAHIRLVEGRLYQPRPGPGGTLDAMVTTDCFTTDHLQLGQVYLYPTATPGKYVRLRLVGVFQQVDPTGPYWPYRYYTSDFFVEPQDLARLLASGQVQLGEAAWYTTLDLSQLTAEQVPTVIQGITRVALQVSGVVPGAAMDVSPYGELSQFLQREQTLSTLLALVSVPILAIALYFVAITAGLIVAADASEIAVFASRGAGVGQILVLYLVEWILLAVPVAFLGPFPAALFSRAMGASQGFLHFVSSYRLPVFIRPVDFAYSGAAAALGVVAAMVPVFAGVGRSIVAARQRASRTIEQPLWQRAYLDAILLVALGVTWWVFRNASVQGGGGAAALVSDPALFLLPPIFLVVAGLLVVRFLGWLLRSLDMAVGPYASPALSLPLRRIGRLPAQFAPVLLLLCFTAALGSYSAASARTLDQNLAADANYQVGADLQLQEVSPCSIMKPEVGVCLTYDDVPLGPNGIRPMPPFSLHQGVPGIAAAAELVVDPVTVNGPNGSAQADLVLVDPVAYAHVAWWMDGLDPQPLWRYVDLLLSEPGAALVDPSLAKQVGMQVGDNFSLSDGVYNGNFIDVAPVKLWPGADNNAPLVVANLSYAKSSMGFIPAYRTALIRLAPGANLTTIENDLADHGIFTQSAALASQQVAQALGTPEWAGQTGMLSVGFLAALGITVLGYLFYAAVLLGGQLSQLGLLFALGLPWRTLVATVAVEQGTLLLGGAAGGTVAGLIAADLFLPLFRPAFTGPSSPPFLALGPGAALGQVAAVLAALLVIALGALLVSLRRLHVGQTLKVEE